MNQKVPFHDQVECFKEFCYLENRLNVSSEAAVIARTRVERIKFKNVELIHRKKISLKMRETIGVVQDQRCKSDTWHRRENEMAILRKEQR